MHSVSKHVEQAAKNLEGVVQGTPCNKHARLSEVYDADVYLKREDLQVVRSYKLRGAYNCISQLSDQQKKKGIVCASAGNHAQGVAYSCAHLGVKGVVFMPKNTPRQKVDRVRSLGGAYIEIVLEGDTFDASYEAACERKEREQLTLVHPFDNEQVIAGQGSVGVEILKQVADADIVVLPVGGGGLVAGVGSYLKDKSPTIQIVGVEPMGAASMNAALKAGQVVTLPDINKFVDGAAVKTVGKRNFTIAQTVVDSMVQVSEDAVCHHMIDHYQQEGLVMEPAGALALAALEELRETIKGKKVVCIVSGGNNDISRYPEVIERSLRHRGLKHYFIVEFSQRPGALRSFLDDALGETDDITLFEYVKKNSRETGPALVGIELTNKNDLDPLLGRMKGLGFSYQYVTPESPLFQFVM